MTTATQVQFFTQKTSVENSSKFPHLQLLGNCSDDSISLLYCVPEGSEGDGGAVLQEEACENPACITTVMACGCWYDQGEPRQDGEEYSWSSFRATVRGHLVVGRTFGRLVHIATIMEIVAEQTHASGSDEQAEAEGKEALDALIALLTAELQVVNLEGKTLQKALKVAAGLRARTGHVDQVSFKLI